MLYNRRIRCSRAPAPMVRLLTPNDYRSMPWKNGAGRTTEIAVHPPGAALDAFAWRVSIADVEQDGPFSRFPGIDRTIVLLGGSGMRLRGTGMGPKGTVRETELSTRFVAHDFSGDDAIDCTLLAGPCRDFNAMFRRSRARGRVAVVRDSETRFEPAQFHVSYRGERCARVRWFRDRGLHRLDEGHALLAAATTSGDEVSIVVRSARVRRRGARRRHRMPMRLFAADALTPRGWRRDVVVEVARDGTIERGRRCRRARGRRARRGSARSGDAQPPFARLPARDRRDRTGQRERGRRQLLDVAAGDVRIPRSRRRRRVRGDRRAGLCRDAEGGLHGGRRIPLRASRSAGQAVRRSGGARAPRSSPRPARPASRSRCCRCSTRIPALAARRRRRGSAGSCIRSTRMRVSSTRSLATRRAASWNLGVAPHSLRAVTPEELSAIVSLAPHERADPHSRRRAGARGRRLRRVERARARSNGCSTTRASTRAGASCTRRT